VTQNPQTLRGCAFHRTSVDRWHRDCLGVAVLTTH